MIFELDCYDFSDINNKFPALFVECVFFLPIHKILSVSRGHKKTVCSDWLVSTSEGSKYSIKSSELNNNNVINL